MIRGRRICAVVPARGGSKGIPRKNLYNINGLSLVERAVRLAKKCPFVEGVYVSTDESETYALAQKLGVATPKPRPAMLATDVARTIDVIRNLVDESVLDAQDCILLLQPTTPLRTLADLNTACELLEREWDNIDAVVSVGAADGSHPYKALVVEDGYLKTLIGRDSSVPRQSLPPAFLPNGALYLAKINPLLREDTFLPRRSLPYVMPPIRSINLDGPLDLILLEAIVSKGLAEEALEDSGI